MTKHGEKEATVSEIKDYIHKVQYHETDKMGITHHSNYIKWMEEARVDFLDQIGYSYESLEAMGIGSPVIGVECEYKLPTTFADIVRISAKVDEFNGVTLRIRYTMVNVATEKAVLTGKTMHCFTDTSGKLIILKKRVPELAALFKRFEEENSKES